VSPSLPLSSPWRLPFPLWALWTWCTLALGSLGNFPLPLFEYPPFAQGASIKEGSNISLRHLHLKWNLRNEMTYNYLFVEISKHSPISSNNIRFLFFHINQKTSVGGTNHPHLVRNYLLKWIPSSLPLSRSSCILAPRKNYKSPNRLSISARKEQMFHSFNISTRQTILIGNATISKNLTNSQTSTSHSGSSCDLVASQALFLQNRVGSKMSIWQILPLG